MEQTQHYIEQPNRKRSFESMREIFASVNSVQEESKKKTGRRFFEGGRVKKVQLTCVVPHTNIKSKHLSPLLLLP